MTATHLGSPLPVAQGGTANTTGAGIAPNIQWFNGTPGTFTWTKPSGAQTVYVIAVGGGGQGGSGAAGHALRRRPDRRRRRRRRRRHRGLAGRVSPAVVGAGDGRRGRKQCRAHRSRERAPVTRDGAAQTQRSDLPDRRRGAARRWRRRRSGRKLAARAASGQRPAGQAAPQSPEAGVGTPHVGAGGAVGGGAGGGLATTTQVPVNGAASSGFSALGCAANTAAGGLVDSTAPGTGSSITIQGNVGCGGGGASSITTNAQAGANAAGYGGGGGGGGATNSSFNSGAGGTGAQGYVLVITTEGCKRPRVLAACRHPWDQSSGSPLSSKGFPAELRGAS